MGSSVAVFPLTHRFARHRLAESTKKIIPVSLAAAGHAFGSTKDKLMGRRTPRGAAGLKGRRETRRGSFLTREHSAAVSFVKTSNDLADAQVGLPVTAKLVPVSNAAGVIIVTKLNGKKHRSSLLEAVVQATETTGKYTAFENEVIKAIINFKWDSHVKERFLLHCKMDIFMVLCFSADALLHAYAYNGSFSSFAYYASWTPTFFNGFLWLYFTNHERLQYKAANASNSSDHHITFFENVTSDIWNGLDFCSLGSIAVTYILRLIEHYDKNDTTFSNSSIAFAFAVPLTFLNLLKYMQGFQVSGELVSMVIGIMKGIMTFTIILVVLMVG